MKSQEIRRSFLDFFAERGHRVERSAPLVPKGDPTLLFTNAGMVPFKDFFLGAQRPPAPRAVSVQKCMRVSGKHNDLDNVGPSHRHHTFFEMLGNFSFGDYFKEEAIRFGWELVTGVWGIPAERLWASVFEDDDEAAALWPRVTSLPPERVVRRGEKDNFWAMGDTGPCGPCSEIFVDVHPDRPEVAFDEGDASGRYLEIWNLVFMQFERDETGGQKPLPDPSIDTGAGLERVAAVLQGVTSNYDTDLFQPILRAAAALAGTEYGTEPERDVDLRVLGDHLRAVSFLLADGVIPGNEGRGYVLRRILRRAARHGLRLGFEEPFLHRLLPVVGEVMGAAYPELAQVERASAATVEAEESRFLETVASGSVQVQEAIDAARAAGRGRLDGATAFRLYDTHGLPLELLREIVEEERMGLDEEGFAAELERQRERSRAAAGGAGERLAAVRELVRQRGGLEATRFVGYDRLRLEAARVVAAFRADGEATEAVGALEGEQQGVVVLDSTPFYAEAGGQLGDRGALHAGQATARVLDTQKDDAGIYYHFVELAGGRLAAGDEVTAEVRPEWRRPTERHHTATHLLHAALRHVLGPSVRQAGSLVAPDRLRFDFTHGSPLAAEEISRVESLVNRWILAGRNTRITPERPLEEALEAGAMALFGEKYGERVRTVEVAGIDTEIAGRAETVPVSLELCGGCHVANTSQIGLFLLTSERGVAAGVRRIEAITGEAALAWIGERRRLLARTAEELGVEEERLADEAAAVRSRARSLEKELARLRLELVSGTAGASGESEVAGVKVVAREVPPAPPNELRTQADVLRNKLGSGVVVLGTRDGERASLVTVVTADLTDRLHAGKLASGIASRMDGKGGGRPDFAQAGGRDPDRLPQALEAVPELVREALGG